jgi:hypothetical protein
MAQTDWTELTGALDIASIGRGVIAGQTPPNGGSLFVYGFNALDASPGASGRHLAIGGGFNPTAHGASVRAALRRGPGGGGNTGFSVFVFLGLQGANVASAGYLLGLCDADPARIVLVKGAIQAGIPNIAPGSSGVLARSTAVVETGSWVHVRLDAIEQPNGDVRLVVYRSDVAAHPVTAPSWAAVPGLDPYTDDALGLASGSAPYTSGRIGFAFRKSSTDRRAFVDHVEALVQLTVP